MTIYISLLRGINVGGQKKVPMADLRALYETLGLGGVTSYIQSGNVIFESGEAKEAALVLRLEGAIEDRFGFAVPVILRTVDAWRAIARRHPLQAHADPAHLHVTCLPRWPSASAVQSLEARETGGDRFTLDGREIYLHCPDGYARSRLTNTVLEKTLGMTATTRNWRTVGKLLELGGEAVATVKRPE